MSKPSPDKAARRAKRAATGKKASVAQHQPVKVFQVPVVRNRNQDDVIGVLTLDPNKMPSGSDWWLQLGVDGDGKIILVTTMKKGDSSRLTK